MSEEEPTKGAPFQSVSTRVMIGSQNKHENNQINKQTKNKCKVQAERMEVLKISLPGDTSLWVK